MPLWILALPNHKLITISNRDNKYKVLLYSGIGRDSNVKTSDQFHLSVYSKEELGVQDHWDLMWLNKENLFTSRRNDYSLWDCIVFMYDLI